jgi:hypothetical protein
VIQSLGEAKTGPHADPELSQVYGAQELTVPGWQVPAPSHQRAEVSVTPVQDGGAQIVSSS